MTNRFGITLLYPNQFNRERVKDRFRSLFTTVPVPPSRAVPQRIQFRIPSRSPVAAGRAGSVQIHWSPRVERGRAELSGRQPFRMRFLSIPDWDRHRRPVPSAAAGSPSPHELVTTGKELSSVEERQR